PVEVDPATVPDEAIAGYSRDQLVNAAHILEAGRALNLGVRDQTIGVMTAMGESSLVVVDHGDTAGPDSRGLFQQRSTGWGSYEDRMDPHISATNFFKALMTIKGRENLTPTTVAHRTQRNADPWHYAPFWPAAVEVVEVLSGISTGLKSDGQCSAPPGDVSSSGWAVPGAGPITSPYGMRMHPIDNVWRLHSGTDLGGGGCDGPIWAAQDGAVIFSGFDSVGNGTITIDHGDGIQTSYLHQHASGLLVREGDKVTAGQQIGRVGNSGQSKGCHLHFMVTVNGSPTDPVPFMAEVGITLG
uniref:M23 family metallopeptidase n=1 Tax=Sanguibacter massiliensis TaxID=1973217 RepID=UPI000C818F19